MSALLSKCRSLIGLLVITGMSMASRQPVQAEANGSLATAEADSNLVAYWKMEEGIGSTVVDASGHGHDLYFANDPADPHFAAYPEVPPQILGNQASLSFDGGG